MKSQQPSELSISILSFKIHVVLLLIAYETGKMQWQIIWNEKYKHINYGCLELKLQISVVV